MAPAGDLTVKFWGVRGSTSTPGKATARYGGHTPCVTVQCGKHMLIFDAGTGIMRLGDTLPSGSYDIFFSHSHYDHIEGLPFFKPLFDEKSSVRLWSGHLGNGGATEHLVRDFMRPPFFPVGPEVMRAKLDYRDFEPGKTLRPAKGITVRTIALNHPGGGVGYRVDYGGSSVCYLSDHEHGIASCDAALARFAGGADLVVYDAMYTDANYHSFIGFGHSTWQEGLRFCSAAGVGRVALFHHHPEASDRALSAISRQAARKFPGALVAREGQTLVV
jgi:phosphoribosyl 1,2-cyclic phosphodiesterase